MDNIHLTEEKQARDFESIIVARKIRQLSLLAFFL
jgi:hypothetical protein